MTPSPYGTIGPFFPNNFADECNDLTVRNGLKALGTEIELTGRVLEEGDVPTTNSIVEIWQSDSNGIFSHPLDPRSAEADPGFFGWGRARTDVNGRYTFRTVLPGAPEGRCPHINVMVLAIGLTRRLVTTVFFGTAGKAEEDPVLRCVPAERRPLLMAVPLDENKWRFDLVLRGGAETPFFLD